MNKNEKLEILAAVSISNDISRADDGLVFPKEALQSLPKKVDNLFKQTSKSLKFGAPGGARVGLFVNNNELSVVAFLPSEFKKKIKDDETGLFTDTREDINRGIAKKIQAAKKLYDECKKIKKEGGAVEAEITKPSIHDNDVESHGSTVRASEDIWSIAESIQTLQEFDDLPDSGATIMLGGIEIDLPKSEKNPEIVRILESDSDNKSYIGKIDYIKFFSQKFILKMDGRSQSMLSEYPNQEIFKQLCDIHKSGKTVEILGSPVVSEGLLKVTEKNEFKFKEIVKIVD